MLWTNEKRERVSEREREVRYFITWLDGCLGLVNVMLTIIVCIKALNGRSLIEMYGLRLRRVQVECARVHIRRYGCIRSDSLFYIICFRPVNNLYRQLLV